MSGFSILESIDLDFLEVEGLGFLRFCFEAEIAGFAAGDFRAGDEIVHGDFPLRQDFFGFPDFGPGLAIGGNG
jgi:hypothetical protein